LAAIVAIVASAWLTDVMLRARVQRATEAAVTVIAVEVDETPSYAEAGLDEEVREFGIEGRAAIVPAAAGDRPDVVGCAMVELGGAEEFECRRRLAHDPTLSASVAIPAARLLEHRRPMLIAGLIVVSLVVAAAALAGVVLARRMLEPLDQLRQAVANLDVRAPTGVELPADSRFDELDALRGAIWQLLTRLEAELARSQRFGAAAAHELRTPLTKIHAELELALESELDPVAARATFERLVRSTDHLVSLSERLLTLATPREAYARDRATSLASLAEDLIARRGPSDAARLSVETGEADGLVRGDEVLLAAMLDNVVDNALKYSAGPVRVAVFERGDEVVVEVEDQGPGIALDQAGALFEPFERGLAGAEQVAPAGLGLGLAIVDQIVRGYAGEVGFVAKPTSGAKLEIRLPRVS
jgi:signal transduction histidine kinase